MESFDKEFTQDFTDLRLIEQDKPKIKKLGFFEKIFKRDSSISKENLAFLDEIKNEQSPLELDDILLLESENKTKSVESLEQNLATSMDSSEKEAVLEVELQNKEIPFSFVLIVFLGVAIALVLFVPKIYIRNNIYYISRDIITLQGQLDSLNEENKYIKKSLEDIKFKNLTQEFDY